MFIIDVPQEIIVGKNDLTVVNANGSNVPAEFAPLLNAIGVMTSTCTVTHIGNNLVLTAGHCLFASPRSVQGTCRGIAVWWGNRLGQKPFLVSKCKKIIAREYNGQRDYAVFEVDKAPVEFIPIDTSTRAPLDTPITIFSHPHTRPLEWSGYCSVADWSNSQKGADQFNHQCDTEPGSSGAPILNTETLKIVGIHNGGGDGWNYATFTTIDKLAACSRATLSVTPIGGTHD